MATISFRYLNMSAHVKPGAPAHCIIRTSGKPWRVIAAFQTFKDAHTALEALSKGEAR